VRWGGTVLGVAAALAVAIASCTPAPVPVVPAPTPGPAGAAEPMVRVGMVVGAAGALLGGPAGVAVTDPSGALLADIPAGETWRARLDGGGLVAVTPAGGATASSQVLELTPSDTAGFVAINGRPYRGTVTILRDRTGLTIVNRLPMEWYLLGVVSAEMGRRAPADQEALQAQAIVSRTYAMRNTRRWDAQGFDLYAGVADQVYGGAGSETPEGREAVEATRGQILTYDGAPIDAFFYSTCGGRTADGPEVFAAANRPYLRSQPDVAEDGTAYCSISPRFRWHEEWTGAQLRSTLQRTLPPALGVPASEVGEIRDVRVTYRTPSGRVGRLSIGLGRTDVDIAGPSVRQVLRPASGELLRSSTFTLTVSSGGGHVTRLAADGAGAGHGVGFCQWGAVGRARAGQDHERILAAYYPGAALERRY